MMYYIVETSRFLLVGACLWGLFYYAADERHRWVAGFHMLTFFGLLGFIVWGFRHDMSWAFSISANVGTSGFVIWSILRGYR